MSRFLILRLEGPLMSFGEVAVDELRPSGLFPGQSMLTGMLANALGWDFAEYDAHQRLQERIVYGARLDRAGEELEDYQTVLTSKQDPLWLSGGLGLLQRGGGEKIVTVIRYRYYRADSRVTVALTLEPPSESPTLGSLAEALRAPARPLFIGRASCPPSAPIYLGEQVPADSPLQALEKAQVFLRRGEVPPRKGLHAQAPWQNDGESDVEPISVRSICDLRDWRNQVHAGRRLVAEVLVRPPATTMEGPL